MASRCLTVLYFPFSLSTPSMVTDFDFDEPTDYGVPISTVMRLLESGEL